MAAEMKVTDAALFAYEAIRDGVGGCTDGHCVIKKPAGMHTNGGCKCHLNPRKAQLMMLAGQKLHEKLKGPQS